MKNRFLIDYKIPIIIGVVAFLAILDLILAILCLNKIKVSKKDYDDNYYTTSVPLVLKSNGAEIGKCELVYHKCLQIRATLNRTYCFDRQSIIAEQDINCNYNCVEMSYERFANIEKVEYNSYVVFVLRKE